MNRRTLLLAIAALPLAACEQDDHHHKRDRDPVTPEPTPIPTPQPTHEIEFRVTGPFQGAVAITQSDSVEGTLSVVSTLPWFATLRTLRAALFVSLEARAAGVGDIAVQIFVDGQLFRQATASGVDPQCAVSGQWNA